MKERHWKPKWDWNLYSVYKRAIILTSFLHDKRAHKLICGRQTAHFRISSHVPECIHLKLRCSYAEHRWSFTPYYKCIDLNMFCRTPRENKSIFLSKKHWNFIILNFNSWNNNINFHHDRDSYSSCSYFLLYWEFSADTLKSWLKVTALGIGKPKNEKICGSI